MMVRTAPVRPRIAITGIGVVSPFGVGRERYWDHVTRGVSGTRTIDEFDASAFGCQVAAALPPIAIDGCAVDRRRRRRGRHRSLRSAALFAGVAGRRHRRARGLGRRRPAPRRAARRRHRRQRRRRHRGRRAAVPRVLHRRPEEGHPLRHPRVDRRHGVERDLDRAAAARHQPRALDRLHELDRRGRLRAVAAARRRSTTRCSPAASTPA